MSELYKPIRRIGLFEKEKHGEEGQESFHLSTERFLDYLNCPRCFYFANHQDHGHQRPPINFQTGVYADICDEVRSRVDAMRGRGENLPEIQAQKVKAFPVALAEFPDWREDGRLEAYHDETRFLLSATLGDVWRDPETRELVLVDFYAGSEKRDHWYQMRGFKKARRKKLDFAAFALKQKGLNQVERGMIVDVHLKPDQNALRFDTDLRVHRVPVRTDWVERQIIRIQDMLSDVEIPRSKGDCDWCKYRGVQRERYGKPSRLASLADRMDGVINRIKEKVKSGKT